MTKFLVVLLAVAVLAVTVMGFKLNGAAGRNRDQVLALENLRAEADTTERRLIAGDSALALQRRLVIQAEIETDAALVAAGVQKGLAAKSQARLVVLEDSLRVVLAGATPEIDTAAGVIRVAGALDATDSLGVKVEAEVTVTLDPPASLWDWNVHRSAMSLSLTMGCEGTTAVANLVGPAWANIDLAHVQQVPELCVPKPRPTWNPLSFKPPGLPMSAALVLLGWVAGSR